MKDFISSATQDDQPFEKFLRRRHKIAKVWQAVFYASTLIAIVFLATLLVNISNRAFGYVAVENRIDPDTLAARPLDDLTEEELAAVIRERLRPNRVRTIERDSGALEQQTWDQLYAIVIEEIVQPKVVKSYPLLESLFFPERVRLDVAENYPQAELEFRSWLNTRFLRVPMSSRPELAGVRTAVLGSMYLILITISIAFPLGVGAAIYLEEYAIGENRINRIIQTNIDNLAGVPSIIYGILGLAVFVRTLGTFTSGAFFGVEGASTGRTLISAGLTMALLILPILIINAQEAIRAVPNSIRQAAYGLGATKWQTVWYHVLPYAMPGILTGTILAISRAIGETAPLIVVGASTFIVSDPTGPFSNFTALPIQIYNWTTRPQDAFRNIAAAAILVLLISLLSLNAIAILLRNRFSKRI
uniref:Phosphate transport system permease protein PstA n=1 Tax=Bellilinea caldifistulae TaxID=360411 RepID=A0A7C4KZV6_9CHLR